MIEAYLTLHGSFIVIWLFMLQYRLKILENRIADVHGDFKNRKTEPVEFDIDAIVDSIQESILDTIGNMRPPTAIDHIAGVWSQIMMMREQAKLVKDGLLPNAFKNGHEAEQFEEI